MSELSDPHDTWSSLLSNLQASLSDQTLPTLIPNEESFHESFEEVCEEVHEPDPQRRLAHFLRQHERIVGFVNVLDESFAFQEPHCLSSLFWSVAITTVKVCRFGHEAEYGH